MIIIPEKPGKINLQHSRAFTNYLIKKVVDAYSLDYSVLVNRPKYRKREYVEARKIVMHLYFKYVENASLARAGAVFHKDHATVLHANKTIENLKETEPAFRKRLERIENSIRVFMQSPDIQEYICIKCHGMNVSVSVYVDPNNPSIDTHQFDHTQPGICYECGETIVVTKIYIHELKMQKYDTAAVPD